MTPPFTRPIRRKLKEYFLYFVPHILRPGTKILLIPLPKYLFNLSICLHPIAWRSMHIISPHLAAWTSSWSLDLWSYFWQALNPLIFIKYHANQVTSLLKSLAPCHPHNKTQISQQSLSYRSLGIRTQTYLTASCLCNEPHTIRLSVHARSTSFTNPIHYCEVTKRQEKNMTAVFLKLNMGKVNV